MSRFLKNICSNFDYLLRFYSIVVLINNCLWTDRQTDSQTKRMTIILTDKQTDRLTDRQTYKHTDRQRMIFLFMGGGCQLPFFKGRLKWWLYPQPK